MNACDAIGLAYINKGELDNLRADVEMFKSNFEVLDSLLEIG